jgi:hypothetical protein
MALKINEIVDKSFAINCKTKAEAIEVCQFLKKKGICWNSGESLDDTNWSRHMDKMCYKLVLNAGRIRVKYGTEVDYKNFKILTSNEFLRGNLPILHIDYIK